MSQQRQWVSLLPPIYRYLPAIYVEQFFDTGSLRLSTISRCRAADDGARGDKNEGLWNLLIQGDGRHVSATLLDNGTSYILCGSTRLSTEIMSAFSGCDAVIEITNPPEFGLAVANQISGFRFGLSGHCIYGDNILMREVDYDPSPNDFTLESVFGSAMEAAQDEHFLLKNRSFANQDEYRFSWFVDHQTNEFLDLCAPDARRWCRRVSQDEIS